MITICTLGFMLYLFVKIGFFALKAAWGIGKIVLTIVFAPLILIGMIFSGLFTLVIPILIVILVVSMIRGVFA